MNENEVGVRDEDQDEMLEEEIVEEETLDGDESVLDAANEDQVSETDGETAVDPQPVDESDLIGDFTELEFLEDSSEGEAPDGQLEAGETQATEEIQEEEQQEGDQEGDQEEDQENFELAVQDSPEAEEEFIEDEFIQSIVESVLFATDKPVSLKSITDVFAGTSVKKDKVKRALEALSVEYAGAKRGVTLEEVTSGYQLRTKVDNLKFLKRAVKTKTFKLSGPALEVLSVIAYKQPVVKSEVDEIRGVDCSHLIRALMDRGLIHFAGKSELPGRPMQYATSRKFLEVFGLRNINELPSLSEIDEIMPEGINQEDDAETLDSLTDRLSEELVASYSEGEDELMQITDKLSEISSSSEFFEQEKVRQREQRDLARADDIREAMIAGEEVSEKDQKWLAKYDEQQLAADVTAEAESSDAAVETASDQEFGFDNEADVDQEADSFDETSLEPGDDPPEEGLTAEQRQMQEIKTAILEFEKDDDNQTDH